MNNKWLIKSSNKKLLLFFNGWGMDDKPFGHLKSSEHDILMFYDYQSLNSLDLLIEEWSKYPQINLVCWSMGVWVANFFADYLTKINFSLAINGSFAPIHDDYGIPCNLFQLTLNNLSSAGREKFYRRMFLNNDDFQKFLAIQPQRDLVNQKKELEMLQYYIQKEPVENKLSLNRVIIGKYDKIIPAKNLINFWENKADSKIINASHYPFFLWNSWEDVLEYAASC